MPERALWPPLPRRRVPLHRLPRQPELSKVKVLHVITRFIAGSGGNTLASATGMDPDRYEVWVAAMPGGPLWAEARAAGVRTVEVPHMRETISPWDDLRACLQLVALMRRERFAVVHTHCSKAGLIGRVAARLAGTPGGDPHVPHPGGPRRPVPDAATGLPVPRETRAVLRPPVRRGGATPGARGGRAAHRTAGPGRRGPVGGRPGVDPRAGRPRDQGGPRDRRPCGGRGDGRPDRGPEGARSTSSGCAPASGASARTSSS